MRLKEGELARNFIAKDINNNTVSLSDFKGKKIILGFYRNVSCLFCNRRIHQLMGRNVRLKEAGVQMVFMFESSNEKLSSSVFHQGISPWPLVGDPEKKIYKIYGVEESWLKAAKTIFVGDLMQAKAYVKPLGLPEDKDASNNLIPADFFINEDFKIVKAHYGSSIDDHISLEELSKFANILNCFF